MNRIDKMLEESESEPSIFTQYVQSDDRKIFLFFEGKDDSKYYRSRIDSMLRCRWVAYASSDSKYDSANVTTYCCQSKEGVLTLYWMITNRTNASDSKKKMFFVDCDYDDNNYDESIFVTPTYSIENLYFSNQAIKSMLHDEMGVSDESENDKNDLEQALDYLLMKRDGIIQDILYGNACYSLIIKKKNLLENKTKINLTPIKEYKDVKEIKEFKDIKNRIELPFDITEDEIEQERSKLASNPVKLIRGKYLLEIMPDHILKVAEELNKKESTLFPNSKKWKVRINTSKYTLISDFSQYADTPDELTEYIEKMLREWF